MQILIVGIGALGGTIAARAIRAGLPVRLAARNTDSAKALRRSGLRVSGIGGEVRADAIDVAAVEDYGKGDQFDVILLGIRAYAARNDVKTYNPRLLEYVRNGGTLIVQYQTPEYDNNYGPFPYQQTRGTEETADE